MDPEDDELNLDPREAARLRRRDRDIDAQHRALMKAGMGKVFKQITDSWGRKGSRDPRHAGKTTRRDG